ncbi:MAG: response regulator transcription factor [Candidatus Latescibacteria bacterium]|jgi:DNA-binding response OmpR family regulator|nr:DNA-binding response regulator [Gemmatimonadaceae bacterium]MDP6014619.1 response regulator transcription factor [Candidatus Latescibacterota bacterium]MDP7449688.1 response regulator transcription factor [Candidatus Latescibacterota bacterium]HJP30135.1 response regulator transcription factor [Candidatus Latescibacterota bacterium]|tara:strand:+ start:47 stop:739 length:693 start_codon:yes stop_codon:yes gene_type:complete
MAQRILMIEDDGALASMVAEYLAGGGFTVDIERRAVTGLTRLRQEAYDALLLDVMLPDGDGFEICKRVRVDSDIPIIMLTARGEETDRIVGLEIGADDYLPKPFSPRELLARLRAVLRRHTPGKVRHETVRLFGRLQISPDARVVSVDDQPCDLTGYQFDLLLALADNAGRVLSRDYLMNRLKGTTVEAFDRSIDVHVSRIRAAIEDDPKKPRRLLTVRGAGYVFAKEQD